EPEDESRLVCHCFNVSEGKIKRLIRENDLHTAEEVTNYIKAGGGCGTCLTDIDDILDEVWYDVSAVATPEFTPTTVTSPVLDKSSVKLTTLQKIALIQEVIDQEIRPALMYDGGNIELYDIEDNLVKVILQGACNGCPSVMTTLNMSVEKRLRDRVSPELRVEAIF
ncbi:MAG: Fe-S cluster assembly protein NifU, partial [Kamptonema sp. SIO4C4]|nr:Fe-S cluster assembly protein NifU [Kamptonema sp. SIO4C4]